MPDLHEFVDHVVETIEFFWPLYAGFAFAIAAVCGRFIYTSFPGRANHATQHPGSIAASRNDERCDRHQAGSPLVRPGVFDQALLPAWTPTAPESFLEYRAFNRRRREARRSHA